LILIHNKEYWMYINYFGASFKLIGLNEMNGRDLVSNKF
jgi:hypothetical protein